MFKSQEITVESCLSRIIRRHFMQFLIGFGITHPRKKEFLFEKYYCQVHVAFVHHRLQIEITPNIPPVSFDRRLMTILLRHLLQNAVQYSPPQSTVEIKADSYDQKKGFLN